MQAIMLAAGKGSRLGKYTEENTKCMLEVNEIKLIDRAINAILEADIHKLILVLGYKKENVKEYLKDKYNNIEIIFIDNDIYDKTNNIYSLYLAKDFLLEDDTILLESDLIYENDLLKKLCDFTYPNAAIVSKYADWMDGTVVTTDEENNILEFIGKNDYNKNEVDYYFKTVNIYKFSKEFSNLYYVPYMKKYMEEFGKNNYYEMVLKLIVQNIKNELKAFKLENELWYEIDNETDLENASEMFKARKRNK